MHYFAPTGLDTLPKNVLFILDVSGSMTGTKLDQTKQAMEIILTDLQAEDVFNILLFSNGISNWNSEAVTANVSNISGAKRFIGEMHANGGMYTVCMFLFTPVIASSVFLSPVHTIPGPVNGI